MTVSAYSISFPGGKVRFALYDERTAATPAPSPIFGVTILDYPLRGPVASTDERLGNEFIKRLPVSYLTAFFCFSTGVNDQERWVPYILPSGIDPILPLLIHEGESHEKAVARAIEESLSYLRTLREENPPFLSATPAIVENEETRTNGEPLDD